MKRHRFTLLAGLGALGLTLAALWGLSRLSFFLSVSEPERAASYLVVEDWLPRYVLKQAVDEFNNSSTYRGVIAIGVDRDQLDDADSLCVIDLPTALVRLGLRGGQDSVVQLLRADVDKDRTLHSALAVQAGRAAGLVPADAALNVLTVGPHARRSLLIYEAALNGETPLGVISITDRRFDAARWWRSSDGFRTVMSEAIAYGYARATTPL